MKRLKQVMDIIIGIIAALAISGLTSLVGTMMIGFPLTIMLDLSAKEVFPPIMWTIFVMMLWMIVVGVAYNAKTETKTDEWP